MCSCTLVIGKRQIPCILLFYLFFLSVCLGYCVVTLQYLLVTELWAHEYAAAIARARCASDVPEYAVKPVQDVNPVVQFTLWRRNSKL